MIPAGYMLKKVARRPEWITAKSVVDIYSASNCVSQNLSDYIDSWEINGYWLFNSPEIIARLTDERKIDLAAMTLFYYELYESEYTDETKEWSAFSPDLSFPTDVAEVRDKRLEGYDVATFSLHNKAECSPLSCCSLATELGVNEHCLFNSFEEAKSSLEEGKFCNSEPGPFRILGVYTIDAQQLSVGL